MEFDVHHDKKFVVSFKSNTLCDDVLSPRHP